MLVNWLVVNFDDWVMVEVIFGGFLVWVCGGDVDIVVMGVDIDLIVNGIMVGINSIYYVWDGQVILLGILWVGLWIYLVVCGGVCVEFVLGLCSYDVMLVIGLLLLWVGDVLLVGEYIDDYFEFDQVLVVVIEEYLVELWVVFGLCDDWLVDLDVLVYIIWMVFNCSDCVGMWLQGCLLQYCWLDW